MQIDDEVLNVLHRSKKVGNQLVLPDQLDRGLYQRVDKVLQAIGASWNRKAKAHIFLGPAAEAVGHILRSGEVTIAEDFGYYPTPSIIVDQMIYLAQIKPGMVVMEPSAGQGAIALKLVATGATVRCVELLHQNCVELTKRQLQVIHGDFLKISADPRIEDLTCDRVVMNPPFEKQADITHVAHALKFLKPDGRLVAVMSAGVRFRDNLVTKAFRALVDRHGGEFIDLPPDSFKESGTGVNTCLVVIPV